MVFLLGRLVTGSPSSPLGGFFSLRKIIALFPLPSRMPSYFAAHQAKPSLGETSNQKDQ